MNANPNTERGLLNPLILVVTILSLLVIGLSAFSVWAYSGYLDQKNNVDQKVSSAVATARTQQSSADAAQYAQAAKSPTLQFVGSPDLGSVKFNYPRTWSGFVASNGEGGSTYQAYFQPGLVPPISTAQTQFALRVSILSQTYQSVLTAFQTAISSGTVKASAVTAGGEVGMRLDGAIEPSVDGIMVVMQIRDQTLEVYTESRTYQPDFDHIIIPSLTFNK